MNYSYNFRIKYYDKVFRNSDIYDVYPDINKISENNNYIKKIGMIRNGSPFGNLVSSRIIDDNEDSYDISYTLSLKIEYIIFLFFMIIFLIIFKYKSDSAFFDKNINIKSAIVKEREFVCENHVNIIYPLKNHNKNYSLEDIYNALNYETNIKVLSLITGNTQVSKTELERLLPIKIKK